MMTLVTPAAERSRRRPPVLALGGGAGAGKTTLASALVERVEGARVVHLDSCYQTDPSVVPSLPGFDGGRVVDRSAPEAIDRERVVATLGEHLRAAPSLVVVEGMFALVLPYLDEWVRWRVYLDLPPDVRLARKALRSLDEGRDLSAVLRGYLERGRDAHHRLVGPSRDDADLVIDATLDVEAQVAQLLVLVR